MEFNRLTVKDLKNLARTRGIRGYSGLRRDQLINLLSNPGTPILDRDNENIRTPVLRPTIAAPTQRRQVNNLLKSLRRIKEVPKSISPELNALKNKIEKIRSSKTKQIKVEKNCSALKNWVEEYKIRGIPGVLPRDFLELSRPEMTKILRNSPNSKVKMVLQCLMGKLDENYVEKLVEANFSSGIHEINLKGTDADELYTDMMIRILINLGNFVSGEGSGWDFRAVIHLKLHTAAYEPLRATGYIELPEWISNKKACINPKNNDDKCFLWAVLIAINPKANHPERIDKDLRSRENGLNMKGIKYPVTSHDIDKFEKQNPEISVNVYSFNEEKKIYPLRITKNEKDKHVDLLYFTNETNNHYVVIKDFSRLMSSQISKNKRKKYFCKRCSNPFGSEKLLQKHKKYCVEHEAVFLKMPEEGSVLRFKNYDRKIEFPVAIYADFESVLLPIETCQLSEKESYTIK